MTWLSFDDDYTDEAVWDGMPYDTRWHYHAFVQKCCSQRRYNGRLPRTSAARCSDVPDPERCLRELVKAGLLWDHGDELEAIFIDDFLPPPGQREEQLRPRKRRNTREYRQRKCQRGDHDRHCPKGCPARVTGNPGGNPPGYPGTGRDGTYTGGEVLDPWAEGTDSASRDGGSGQAERRAG